MDGGGAEQSDLDAAELAALRRAMDGLRDKGRRESAAPVSGFRPRFADLESWVHEFFVLTFGRHTEQGRWCARWWDHPEAILRLDALGVLGRWRRWIRFTVWPTGSTITWIPTSRSF